MDSNPDHPDERYPCTHCAGGIRTLKHLTYFTWLDDQLITVPNFPAWVCDACGRRDYDVRAVSWLNTMLKSPKKRTSTRRPAQPPPNPDAPPL